MYMTSNGSAGDITGQRVLVLIQRISASQIARKELALKSKLIYTLSGIEVIEGKRILRYLSVNTRNGVLLPNGDPYDNWDVAEFAMNMKDYEDNE
jgi:hypothetical protein